MTSAGRHFDSGVYHSEGYLRAASLLEPDGTLHIVRHGRSVTPLVVKPLPAGCGPGFDAVSPYDFSGPLPNGESPRQLWEVLSGWAREHDILAAFLRFHPFRGQVRAWERLDGLEVVHSADNVVIELGEADGGQRRFKPQVQRDLKVARRAGVSCSIATAAQEDMDIFVPLYGASMDRLGADAYYRFSREFFDRLVAGVGQDLKLASATIGRTTVAAALLLMEGRTAFYYLACSSDAGRKSCAMNMLVAESAGWLREAGCERFHLGGGSPSLRHFKGRFGPSRVPYFIGRAVFDARRYAELTEGLPADYFPAYRAPTPVAAGV